MKLLLLLLLCLACVAHADIGNKDFRVNFFYSSGALGTGARIVGELRYDWNNNWWRADYLDINAGATPGTGGLFLTEVFDIAQTRRYSYGNPLSQCPCETARWVQPMPLFWVDDDRPSGQGGPTHVAQPSLDFTLAGNADSVVANQAITCKAWATVNPGAFEVETLWLQNGPGGDSRVGRPCKANFQGGIGNWTFDTGQGPYPADYTNQFGASGYTWNGNPGKSTFFDPLPTTDNYFSGSPRTVNCPEPTCTSRADIIFVLDESGSISDSQFDDLQAFVSGLINAFTWGEDASFGGVVFFTGVSSGHIRSNSNTWLPVATPGLVQGACRRKFKNGCQDDGSDGECNDNDDCCAIWSSVETTYSGFTQNVGATGGKPQCVQNTKPAGFGLAYRVGEVVGDKNTLLGLVNNRAQIKRHTCIGCGIRAGLAHLKNFHQNTPSGIARRADGVPSIIMTLTDGANNRERITFYQDIQECLDYGVQMWAVGVGNYVLSELRRITGCPASNLNLNWNDPTDSGCGLVKTGSCNYAAESADDRCARYDEDAFPKGRIFEASSFSQSQLDPIKEALSINFCQPLPPTGACVDCQGLCACGATCLCPSVCDDGNACTFDVCGLAGGAPDTGGNCLFQTVGQTSIENYCKSDPGCGDVSCDPCFDVSCDPTVQAGTSLAKVSGQNYWTKSVLVTNVPGARPQEQHVGCRYTPKNCGGGKGQCIDQFCDSSGQCQESKNVAKCDDSKACTKDTCNNDGSCSYDLLTCTGLNTACATFACDNATTRECQQISTTNCDDGNPCTTTACNAASGCFNVTVDLCCNPGTGLPTDCSGFGNKCQQFTCDRDSGACVNDASYVHPLKACCDPANGQEKACPPADPCDVMVCDPNVGCKVDFVKKCCVPGVGTIGDIACDDSNPCTKDSCNPTTGACSYTDLPCCDPATGKDLVCDDSNLCTTDKCDPAASRFGQCVFSKGDPCCVPATGLPLNCDDSDMCTFDSCNATGHCVNEGGAGGCACFNCDDSNPCTVDKCFLDGGTPKCDNSAKVFPCCNPATGKALVCDDSDPCTVDECDTATDVCKTPPDKLFPCCVDDGAGNPIFNPCDDSNPCTTDACNPTTGVCFASNTDLCCDPATGGPKCTNGGDVCKNAVCDTATGACSTPSKFDCCIDVGGVATVNTCDDSNPCTKDSCSADTCSNTLLFPCCDPATGLGKTCNDGNPCTDDSCDAATGACLNPTVTCDDSDPCTDDSCDMTTGKCVFAPKNCQGTDGCRSYSCNPTTGACQDEEHGLCGAGNPCSVVGCNSLGANNYTCIYGLKCDPSQPTGTTFGINNLQQGINDNNPCTRDWCDAGACRNTLWTDTIPDFCDDGNPCTQDICDPLNFNDPPLGPCSNTPQPASFCDDGNPCSVDRCDPTRPANDSCVRSNFNCQAVSPCGVPKCAANATSVILEGNVTAVVTGCYDEPQFGLYDVCGVCDGDGISCFLNSLQGSSKAKAIGIGAGVGIAIAVLVGIALAVFGGRQGYLAYNNRGKDKFGGAHNNPLHQENELGGEVPDGLQMEDMNRGSARLNG